MTKTHSLLTALFVFMLASGSHGQVTCSKDCGAGDGPAIGHRGCQDGEYGCHVSLCSDYHQLPCAYFDDRYNDLCATNTETPPWECTSFYVHGCYPL